jgi:hypothetical protein
MPPLNYLSGASTLPAAANNSQTLKLLVSELEIRSDCRSVTKKTIHKRFGLIICLYYITKTLRFH